GDAQRWGRRVRSWREDVPHVALERGRERERRPARLRRADRDGERAARRDAAERLGRDRLGRNDRVPTADEAIHPVEARIGPGGVVRLRERLGIAPRERDEEDADAEENDDPAECARCTEEAFERVADQPRVARSTAAISSTRVRRE